MNGIQEHHHWSSVVIAALLALIVGGVVGYYIGSSQSDQAAETSVVEEIAEGVERPANPFEPGGYQNPLQGVKLNPFE